MKTVAIALALTLAGCNHSSSDDDDDSTSSDSGTVLSTGGTDGSGSSLTYYGTAKAILDTSCAPCHGIPAAAGAPGTFALDRYVDEGSVAGAFSMLSRIDARVLDGTMPPADSGYLLSDDQKAALATWIGGDGAKGPTFSFVSPANGGEAANTSYSVAVHFADADASATWSLYQVDAPDGATGGSLIADGIPAATTTYAWDTSSLSAGTYYVYATLTNLGETVTRAASGSIAVSHPEPGNDAPTVTVTSPNGAEVLSAGSTAIIAYSAADPNAGDVDILSFTIEVSINAGSTWTVVATNHSGLSYNWSVPANATQGVKYRVRVTADDGKGGIASDTSDANFGVATTSLTYLGSIKGILQPSCSSCHDTSGGSQRMKFRWDSYTSSGLGAFDLRDRIIVRTADDSMPVSGGGNPNLSQADKDEIQLWVWGGAPN